MDNLDDYSRRFSGVLFEAFPEWRQFASVQKAEATDETGFLVVKVPAPTGGLITNVSVAQQVDFLWVDSAGEVTVGFDYHHTHFDNFGHQSEAEIFAAAVEFIKSIVGEEICFVAVFNGSSFCGSTSAPAGEVPDLSGWGWLHQSCQDVYLRSWHGRYNRRYKIAEVLGGHGGASYEGDESNSQPASVSSSTMRARR
jgi:hypothetical protein